MIPAILRKKFLLGKVVFKVDPLLLLQVAVIAAQCTRLAEIIVSPHIGNQIIVCPMQFMALDRVAKECPSYHYCVYRWVWVKPCLIQGQVALYYYLRLRCCIN